jgi:hypothetical protein
MIIFIKTFKSLNIITPLRITAIYLSRVASNRLLYLGVLVSTLLVGSEVGVLESLSHPRGSSQGGPPRGA